MKQKWLALLTTIAMLVTLLPAGALAATEDGSPAHEGSINCSHSCAEGSCAYRPAQEAVEGTPCDYACTEELAPAQTCTEELAEGESCTEDLAPAETCSHSCGDGSCGFAEGTPATDEVACDHDCATANCPFVCNADCAACAAPANTQQPQPMMGLAAPVDSMVLAPTDQDSFAKLLDENAAINLTDGMTLDLSGMKSIPSARVNGQSWVFPVNVSGNATIIGYKGTASLRRLNIVLADDSNLTIDGFKLFFDGKYTLEPGAQATLSLVGENTWIEADGISLNIPADSQLTITGEGSFRSDVPAIGQGNLVIENPTTTMGALGVPTQVTGGTFTASSSSAGLVLDGAQAELTGNKSTTLSGGAALRNGSVLKVSAPNFAAAISGGEVFVDATSTLVAVGSQNKNSYQHTISNVNLTLEAGATFAAFGVYNAGSITQTAVGEGVTLPDGMELYQGRLDDLGKDTKTIPFRVNSGSLISFPSNAHLNFAVATARADSYTVSDKNGLSTLVPVSETDTDLVWSKVEIAPLAASLLLEDGNIVVSPMDTEEKSEFAYMVTQGSGLYGLAPGAPLNITQEAKTTDANITLETGVENLEVSLTDVHSNTAVTNQKAPLSLEAGASATLVLHGENSLVCGIYSAGVQLADGAHLTIRGEGSLLAQSTDISSAGIGRPMRSTNAPTYLTIESGTVRAIGYSHGAGIGGSNQKQDGLNVTITGTANVYAQGGNFAAGIGGSQYGNGASTTISGNAIVEVHGGSSSAAIGGGEATPTISTDSKEILGGQAGRIEILENATVTAIAGSGAAALGRGITGDNKAVPVQDADCIVISGNVKLTAYSLYSGPNPESPQNYYFAVDVGVSTDIAVSMLNARFKNQFAPQIDVPVNLRQGDETVALTLPGYYGTYHGFASTLAPGTWKVQDGRTGNELSFANYDVAINDQSDKAYEYTVEADKMTVRDGLYYDSFTVNATKEGSGTISPEGNTRVAPNGSLKVTFAPLTGNHVSRILVNGQAVTLQENSYTFENITQDSSIHVVFAANTTGGGGDEEEDDNPPTGGGQEPGGPGEDGGENITDPDVPLVNPPTEETLPETDIPLAETPEVDILEPEVPLSDLPKTGGASLALGLAGLVTLGTGLRLKKKEQEGESK